MGTGKFLCMYSSSLWTTLLGKWSLVVRLLPSRKRNQNRMCPKVNLIGQYKKTRSHLTNGRFSTTSSMGVSPTQFKNILATGLVKEAWGILQVEFKGTIIVRKSRIELLISKFENL